MVEYRAHLHDEEDTIAFGRLLARQFTSGGRIYIHGDLGAGKTTLCRGIVRHFGYDGAVKSPTFTLVEPYELDKQTIYHFDLYRLGDPNELEYIGVDEYFRARNLCLVEWPERAEETLPQCDLEVRLSISGKSRDIMLLSGTALGEKACQAIASDLPSTSENEPSRPGSHSSDLTQGERSGTTGTL